MLDKGRPQWKERQPVGVLYTSTYLCVCVKCEVIRQEDIRSGGGVVTLFCTHAMYSPVANGCYAY